MCIFYYLCNIWTALSSRSDAATGAGVYRMETIDLPPDWMDDKKETFFKLIERRRHCSHLCVDDNNQVVAMETFDRLVLYSCKCLLQRERASVSLLFFNSSQALLRVRACACACVLGRSRELHSGKVRVIKCIYGNVYSSYRSF